VSTSAPYWNDEPMEWDALRVASSTGLTLLAPGIVDDLKPTDSVKIDEREASGVQGATIGFNGRKLSRVAIKLRIWSPTQFARIEPFLTEIRPRSKGGAPAPHDYSHPILALWGLTSLLYLDCEGPTIPGVRGISYLTIRLIEFAPPPKKSVSAPITKGVGLNGTNALSAYGATTGADGFNFAGTASAARPTYLPSGFDATGGVGAFGSPQPSAAWRAVKPSSGGSTP